MSTFTPPASMARLLNAALAHRRSYRVHHQTDNAGNPFVTVTVRWSDIYGYQPSNIEATWHTRATGTYRLMRVSGMWPRCEHAQISLTRAIQLVTGEWVPQQVTDLLDDIERQGASTASLA